MRLLKSCLGALAALATVAVCASSAHADKTQYFFLVDDIHLRDGVPDMVEGLIRKQSKKTIDKHPRLLADLPEDAPDPRTEPAAFEKYVKRAGLDPYGVRIEITSYDQEVEPIGRGRSGNHIKVAISLRVLGVTLSKSTFGFTGEGSATIKAEAGKKVRKRDIKFTNQDAVEISIDEAMAMAIKRLDEKRAKNKRKFRKKKRRKRRKKTKRRKKKS